MKKKFLGICTLALIFTACTNETVVEEPKNDEIIQEEVVNNAPTEDEIEYSEEVLSARAFMQRYCGGEYEDITLQEENDIESYVSFSEVVSDETTNYAEYGIATYTMGILYDSSCISASDNEYIFLQDELYYKILVDNSTFEMYIGNAENEINSLTASCSLE